MRPGSYSRSSRPASRLRLLACGLGAVFSTSCPGQVEPKLAPSAARRADAAQAGPPTRAALPAPVEATVPVATRRPEGDTSETKALLPEPALSSSQLHSIGRETWVYARPSYSSRRLGYLRLGGVVQCAAEPSGYESCPGGWRRVTPEGYVCNNERTATTKAEHRLAQITEVEPERSDALPYRYALASRGVPRFHQSMKALGGPEAAAVTSGSIPTWWEQSSKIFGFAHLTGDSARLGLAGSGIAFTREFAWGRGRYGLTPNLELVELMALRPVEPSRFHGHEVASRSSRAIAFVKTKSGFLYQASKPGAARRIARPLSYREAFALGESVTGDEQWLRTERDEFLRKTDVRVIAFPERVPDWVTPGKIWVDVSIGQQSLIAYEGDEPKYVTLVSTGVDGISDPTTSKATKQGVFAIEAKHLTITMDGQDDSHAYEMNEVPWVQYFSEGYALHAAYWHDDFGSPKSHGCINLSPRDARWLFHFTNPGVPQGWHGRRVAKEDAAAVYVHP